MPAALKLKEQFGDDLHVVFVESQGATADVHEAFVWRMKWMGLGGLWTSEQPFPTLGDGLPETALVGVDGKILFQGYPDHGKIEELIVAELRKAKDAPEGTPKELKQAWKDWMKGDLATALAACDKVANDAGAELRGKITSRFEREVEAAKWCIDNGYMAVAEERLRKLQKEARGVAALESLAKVQAERLAAPELAKEVEADKAWSAFAATAARKKPFDEPNVKKAQALADKHAGTKAGARAQRFVVLSKVK